MDGYATLTQLPISQHSWSMLSESIKIMLHSILFGLSKLIPEVFKRKCQKNYAIFYLFKTSTLCHISPSCDIEVKFLDNVSMLKILLKKSQERSGGAQLMEESSYLLIYNPSNWKRWFHSSLKLHDLILQLSGSRLTDLNLSKSLNYHVTAYSQPKNACVFSYFSPLRLISAVIDL